MQSGILQAINGVSFAALLFLLASGFTISFGLMRVVNMAHGAYYLLGGYIGLSIVRYTGSFGLGVLGGGLAIIPIGYLIDRYLIRRTGENHLAQVLLTVGIAFVMGDIALKIWGGDNLKVPTPIELRGALELPGGIVYPTYRFVLILFGIVVGLSLWLLYRKTQIGAVVAELVRLAATGEGAVLIVDDLHDADEASLRLLHYLARIAVEEPITIVVAHRPWPLRPAMDAMRRSLIGRGPSVVQLDLGPMSEADIRRLAARTLSSDERSLDRVAKLAGGNPFAAVELARIFASGDDGPAPMGALVLHGLGDAAVGALTRVAVLGSEFDTDEYAALSGLDEDQAYACLDEAMAADAVERTGDGYRFRHALVRDALLDPVPPHHRLRLHRQAADALSGLGASPARDRSTAAPGRRRRRRRSVHPAGGPHRRRDRRVQRRARAARGDPRRRPRCRARSTAGPPSRHADGHR